MGDIARKFYRGTDRAEERSASTGFGEYSGLSDIQKEELCRTLLSEFGVSNISRMSSTGELIHSCCLPFGLHKNGDLNPSASLNYQRLTYNCFSSETEIITNNGIFQISQLVGKYPILLDGDGNWVKSEIRSFGVQKLMKLVLSRNGIEKVVFVTPNHRWLKKGGYGRSKLIEVTTDELRTGHRIPSIFPNKLDLVISKKGVAHGFVYGDGTADKYSAIAYFVPPKDIPLLQFYPGCTPTVRKDGVLRIGKLSLLWKSIPSLDSDPNYLYGWLAGYFAADGCVAEDGHISLASSKRVELEMVLAICDRIGVGTFGIRSQSRLGYGVENSNIYSITLVSSTLNEEFFILPHHRGRFIQAKERGRIERTGWIVKSVEEANRIEEVFCAIVPTTHTFVLKDHLLTSNCFGCGNSGGLLWFIGVCRGTSSTQARGWLANYAGVGDSSNLAKLLEFFDTVYTPRKNNQTPIPKFSKKILDGWRFIHPYMTEIRNIPEEILIQFNIGWNPETNRIVLPHFWKDELVGWQTRRLVDDGSPKYLSSVDFPKRQTIYNYQPEKPVVVVESVISVLSKYAIYPNIEATFGMELPERQVQLLAAHPRVTLFFDNDQAGYKATNTVGTKLMPYTDVRVVDNPWSADAGDMDEITFMELVNNAIPFEIWSPTKEVKEWQ